MQQVLTIKIYTYIYLMDYISNLLLFRNQNGNWKNNFKFKSNTDIL